MKSKTDQADRQDVTTHVSPALPQPRHVPGVPTIPSPLPDCACPHAHSEPWPSTVPAAHALPLAVLARHHGTAGHVLPVPRIDLSCITLNVSLTAQKQCISTERHVNDAIQVVHPVSTPLPLAHHVPITPSSRLGCVRLWIAILRLGWGYV